METIQIKLNYNLHGYKKGDVITVRSLNGTPTDTYWNRRFHEAANDNCIEVVKPQTVKSKKPLKNLKELNNDPKLS